MTSIYEMFATDEQKEQEGIVHEITPEISFTLARAGGFNKRFSKALEKKTRPYRRQIQEDTMDVDLANKLFVEAFAETVLLGWKGVTDTEGKPVKFNAKNAVKLLTDLPDLANELREVATKASSFRNAEIKDDVGN